MILPCSALQVTDLLVVEPATVALNGSVPPVAEFAVEGVMVTAGNALDPAWPLTAAPTQPDAQVDTITIANRLTKAVSLL